MASFSDITPQFNPYIQQLPVETMVKVGMQKQEQYDAGIQKIQTQIDNIAGLDILRPVDKQYLQSKLNELGNNLRGVSGADFSNFQLVNSVSGMTNQIVKDGNIQSAVYSTSNHRKQQERIEADRASGKLTPDNEWNYTDQLNGYMNSTDLGRQFNGKYIPHYDVDKDIQEAIKAAHFDKAEWDELPKNPDGTLNSDLIVHKAKEGLLSGKVRNIVGTVFAKPEVQQQLMISGRYNYKDYTPKMLKDTQDESLAYYINQAEEQKKQLILQGAISKKDNANINQGLIDIDNALVKKQQEYSEMVKLIMSNPELAKVQLYRDNQIERYVSDYSWESNSQKLDVNPGFTVSMRRADYNLSLAKYNFDVGDANRKFNLEERKLALQELDEKRKQAIAEGKLNPDGSPKILYTPGAIDADRVSGIGSATYKADTDKLIIEKNQLQAELISTLPGYEDLYVRDPNTGEYKFNREKYKNWNDINSMYRRAIVALDKAHQNGSIKNNYAGKVERLYDLFTLVEQNQGNIDKIEEKFRPQLEKFLQDFNKNKYAKDVYRIGLKNEDGDIKQYDFTKEDYFMYMQWRNAPLIGSTETQRLAAKDAEQYFIKKYGEQGWNDVQDIVSSNERKRKGLSSTSGPDNSSLWSMFSTVEQLYDNNPGIADALKKKEDEYKVLQQQTQYYHGTVNIAKPEDKLAVNSIYSSVLADIMQNKSGGVYEKMSKMLEASSPQELNNNNYEFYKGADNKWYIQVRQLQKGGGYKVSEPLPVEYNVIQTLGGKVDENEEAFNYKFQPFLNNNRGLQTTAKLKSPEAGVTALMRRNIGKYSVGWHLKSFGDGYVPYAYITDTETGQVLANGLDLDLSVYANDKRLTEKQRQIAKSVQTIMSKQDVITKLNTIDESLIELMLKNN